MIKKRLIACLIVKDGIVVQSINFRRYLPVGKPEIAVEYLNSWGIDEIVLLNIAATRGKPDLELIRRVSKKCLVPLTVGGGISSVQNMREILKAGADKVSINTAIFKDPDLITESAKVFGNQAIVVSLDVRNMSGQYEVFSDGGRAATGQDPVTVAKRSQQLGAGEILINSIDRDGSKLGYDIKLIQSITKAVQIPVIACGGVGHPKHFSAGIKDGDAPAVAAGNFFHFTEHSVVVAKAYLSANGIDIRHDTHSDYHDFQFDQNGRIKRKSEQSLLALRYKHVEEEVI